jgi:hypothetical protein
MSEMAHAFADEPMHAHAPTADRQPDHTGKEIANVVVRLQTARQ